MTDTRLPRPGNRFDARELALRAASLLAGGRASDPGWVRAAAGPIIAWAEQGDGSDIGLRCRALELLLDNMRALQATGGDLAGYTPQGFAAAADGYRRSLAGEPAPALPDTAGYAAARVTVDAEDLAAVLAVTGPGGVFPDDQPGLLARMRRLESAVAGTAGYAGVPRPGEQDPPSGRHTGADGGYPGAGWTISREQS
jgi:hypothetical protein